MLEGPEELLEEISDDPEEEVDYDETIWEENEDSGDEIEDDFLIDEEDDEDEDEGEYGELEEIDDLDDITGSEDDFSEIDVGIDDDSDEE